MAIIAVILVLSGSSACSATHLPGGVEFGSAHIIRSGEVAEQDVLLFGGSLTVEKDAKMKGSAILFGSQATIDGNMHGDLVLFGGHLVLGNTAEVTGDITSLGGAIETIPGAIVTGKVGVESWNEPSGIDKQPSPLSPVIQLVDYGLKILWIIVESIAMAVLAALAAMFLPRPMERVGDAVAAQPVPSGLMGALTVIAAPFVALVLSITLILIPAALLGIAALMAALMMGWISLGLLMGSRMADSFNQQWSMPVSAGLGTLTITLAARFAYLIPCVGWLVMVVAACAGLGAVVFTRFGSAAYPPAEDTAAGNAAVPPANPI